MNQSRRGEALVLAAYTAFGVLPIFWRLLHHLPPEQILFHRALWSAVGLGIYLVYRGRLLPLLKSLREPGKIRSVTVSAALLGVNWFTYLIALKDGHLAECSLGYFICPLFSMALGYFFYRERLNFAQCAGIFLVAIGVLARIFVVGKMPWIALLLAVSFSSYQLVRKRMAFQPADAFFLESYALAALAFPLAYSALHSPSAVFFAPDNGPQLLLILTGVVTTVPMLWLLCGAKRVSMRFLGISQYVSPTLSLLIATGLYGETFNGADAVSFAFIWFGIIVYFADRWLRRKLEKSLLDTRIPDNVCAEEVPRCLRSLQRQFPALIRDSQVKSG